MGLEGLLQRIEGDYAFGIWDERKGLLSLARDRIGVKPLYFARINGVLCICFGDEGAGRASGLRAGNRSATRCIIICRS